MGRQVVAGQHGGRAPLLAALAILGAGFVGINARADTGGPDAYGYVWVDSLTPSPTVQFSWIDILSTGSRLPDVKDDYCTFEVSLGFQFRYYGTITNDVYICSDGFITFSVPDSFKADPPIPSPAIPNNRVVALGMDLNPAASGGIYVLSRATQTPKRFVVTWDNVAKTSTNQRETFQIVLEQNETTKDGRILFQYRFLAGVSAPLVGIENVDGSSGLAYPKPLQNNLAVQFLPPSDASLPPDELHVAGAPLAPPSVVQGATNVPMMSVDLATTTNDIQVNSLRVTLSGLRAGPEDVPTARLWLDNGDGSFSIGSDGLLKTAGFSGTPPVSSFELQPALQIVAGAPRRLYVTFNIAVNAGVGDWIGARLASATSISVEFPDTVDAGGLPFDTYVANVRTRIDASRDTLRLALATPLAPAEVEQWQMDVPMLSLRFDADRNFVTVGGLSVALGGNVSAADVWAVKVLRDRDGDGLYTPGTDEVLAVESPSGSPPRATLSFFLNVSAGTPETLLILADITPDATLGAALNVTVDDTDVFVVGGGPDGVNPANFPASGGNASITPGSRPTLRIPWVSVAPQADGTWRENEYLLGPDHTVSLDRPAGNQVLAFLTAQNNATVLYLAVDVVYDVTQESQDGMVIAFDTDADGIPTPGADDRFAVNATGGARLAYDGGSGSWKVVAPCDSWAGSAAVPSCVAGRGATAFRTLAHRFYEFQIPLSMFGIGFPIPPGRTVRFAIAGEPHLGLVDGGNRSTWPILLAASPPLAYLGGLELSTGPAPNRPPSLEWLGTPGYETDGIQPDAGYSNTTFAYRINYFDLDNDPPAVGQPVIHILRDASEITGSPFTMAAEDSRDVDHRDGKTFLFLAVGLLPCGGNNTYWFTARDARGLQNATTALPGPQVACPNQPPILSGESVTPIVASAGSAFAYRVTYQDPEGASPFLIEAAIRRGEVDVGNTSLSLAGFVGTPGDFSQGAIYGGQMILTEPGYNYTFRFHASDGNLSTETSWFFGPYVLVPPPDVLTVAGVDLAPLIVDEGSRRIPFLQLHFLTSDPDVNVTSVRVDRLGSAGDFEVERILLYHDTDRSGTVNGPDVLLGSKPPLQGTATFPVSLRATPGNPASIIFLLNLTRPGTPDGTVGLEVKDASYVSVGPGDTVQAFPSFRSTRALVNVAPSALDPFVDGFGAGTAGIRHVVSDAPLLSWRYADENGGDVNQAAYNVSLWSASPLALLWYRNESDTASAVTYAGPTLAEGQAYLLQALVSDGRLWSAPGSVLFRINSPPPAPEPFAPGDLARDIDPNATLLWQPVADADGDGITYWYWVDDDIGFASPKAGFTMSPGVTVSLAAGTAYYWKIAASDGYEVTGNTTVWRFTTRSTVPPVRGEISGRVLNGTTPLAEALVQLTVDGSVTQATVTEGNGTFRFSDLDLGEYLVRANAFGFRSRLVAANLTETSPVVDLGDLLLEPIPTGEDGGNPAPPAFPWLLVILAIVLTAIFTSIVNAFLFRRKRPNPDDADAGRSEGADSDLEEEGDRGQS